MSSADAKSVIASPIGFISLSSGGGKLTRIEITESPSKEYGQCRLLQKVTAQMRDYLQGKRQRWNLDFERDLSPASTPWQQQIRTAMLATPWGKTISYGDLAACANGNSRLHARAAGQACGANMLPLLIPCHRVLAYDQKLGGYGGGLERKKWLLRLEGHSL